jgi:YbbR domain-containing protein
MLHRNLPLKIAAFALAIFLWFWVLLSEEKPSMVASGIRPIELNLVGKPPSGYELIGVEASPKVARISGPRSRVDQTARLLVTVDLREAVPEVPVTVAVSAANSAGERVEGVSLVPPRATVVVKMRPAMSPRTLPVALRTEGALAADLRIVSVQVDPPLVTVLGSPDRVGAVDRVETERLALHQVQGSSTEELKLLAPEGLELLSGASVSVRLDVERARPQASEEERPASD